jgi:hypothetical protein
MTFRQIGLPAAVLVPRIAGLPAGTWRDGAIFRTFQAVTSGEAERR